MSRTARSRQALIRRAPRLTSALVAAGASVLLVPAATQAACYSYTPVEAELARLVNVARSKNGLRPMRADLQVGRVSRLHSREMASRGSLYHTPKATLEWRITNWTRLGENIAWVGNAASMTAKQRATTAFRMFMRSPSHRSNLLRRSWRYQGIGVGWSGSGMYVTNDFQATNDPGTRLSMPRC